MSDCFRMFSVMWNVSIFLILFILLEKLRRKDLEIVNAIEEKEKILAEMFQVPYEEFKASKEVGDLKSYVQIHEWKKPLIIVEFLNIS